MEDVLIDCFSPQAFLSEEKRNVRMLAFPCFFSSAVMRTCICGHTRIRTLLRERRSILDLVVLPSVELAGAEPSGRAGLLVRPLGFCSLRQSPPRQDRTASFLTQGIPATKSWSQKKLFSLKK